MGIVGGSGVGDCPVKAMVRFTRSVNRLQIKPGAPGVEVAEVVGEHLKLVSTEVTIVPQNVVVARS